MEIPRQGSQTSTKAMARAAVDRRKVVIELARDWQISGYLVGMDDYHWLIMEQRNSITDPFITLIHKAAPYVLITKVVLDEDAHPNFVDQVKKVGQSFWDYCEKTYLGRNGE